MRWLLKASLQSMLSALPAGERVNYAFQRRVLRTLPGGEAAFRRKFGRALAHFQAFLDHGSASPAEAVFYEFGAGWDLVVPLAYRALGLERQILVDIRPLARLELVNDTIAKFGCHAADLEHVSGRPLRPLGAPDVATVEDLRHRFGIDYLAPRDARATGLPSASVDFVSSTVTLEHVPAEDLLPILAECRRLLKPDGAMSCRIDLRDHFSYFDKSLSPYNFLKFSDRIWRLANSRLNFQNRLRYTDYLRLFSTAGFEVIAEHVARPGEAGLAALATVELAQPFRNGYSLDELGATSLSVVVRPASPDARVEVRDLSG